MFSKKLRVVCLLWGGLLSLAAGSARAQDLASARVLSMEGQVEIRRPSGAQAQIQKISFNINDALNAGDTIVTGRGGRLVLGLSDGSQAVIAPQTTVVIQDLKQSPRTLFHILRGKTRVRIEKLGGQPNPYRVNTPTAVIAVRGTTFDVLVKDDETEVFLHEGEVAITNLVLPNQSVFLTAGQMTRVPRLRLPNTPSTFKFGRNDDAFRLKSEQRDDNRQTASRGENRDFGRGSRDGRGAGRPDARPDFERSGSQSGGARPNSGSRGGGGRP